MQRTFPLSAATLLVLFLFTMSMSAQEQETLFDAPVEHGGFGALVTKVTPVRGELGVMVGGYGGWLINHRFMIGAGGYGLTNNVRASAEAESHYSIDGERLYLEFGYGGLMFEYIYAPHKLVHLNLHTLIGAGGVNYREDWHDYVDGDSNRRRYGRGNAVFVVEPTLSVEVNVTTWFRIAAGGSYRFVGGIDDLIGIESTDLAGPSGTLSLKFGKF